MGVAYDVGRVTGHVFDVHGGQIMRP